MFVLTVCVREMYLCGYGKGNLMVVAFGGILLYYNEERMAD